MVLAMAAAPRISIDLDMPFEEGKALLDGTVFSVNNIVGLRIGYPDVDAWTPWAYGFITANGNNLQLSPNGVSGSIDTAVVTRVFGARRSFRDAASRLQVVELIAKLVGMELVITPDAGTFLSATGIHVQGVDTYWDTLRENLEEAGCVFWIGTDLQTLKQTIFISTSSEVMRKHPTRAYVMNGDIRPDLNQFPILNIAPEGFGNAFLAGTNALETAGTTFVILDERTGEFAAYSYATEDLDEKTGGAVLFNTEPTRDVKFGLSEMDRILEPDEFIGYTLIVPPRTNAAPDVGAIRRSVVAQVKARANTATMKANLTTLGNPLQQPMELVSVLNVGGRMEGNWFVNTVTHTYGSGSFDTVLEIQNNATADNATSDATTKGGQNAARP